MRQFGNMFRVGDCPADIATNRIGMMDLRMLSGNTAVHSDMITWHDDERPEDAALQILNTIFGVTQFSKIIRKLRPDQKKMMEFWLRFERENQRVLQESKLIPFEPQFLYPVITACDEQEEIIAVYADSKVISPDFSKRKTQLVNACWHPFLTVRVPEETKAAVKIYDCMGNAVEDTTRVLSRGYSGNCRAPQRAGCHHVHSEVRKEPLSCRVIDLFGIIGGSFHDLCNGMVRWLRRTEACGNPKDVSRGHCPIYRRLFAGGHGPVVRISCLPGRGIRLAR